MSRSAGLRLGIEGCDVLAGYSTKGDAVVRSCRQALAMEWSSCSRDSHRTSSARA